MRAKNWKTNTIHYREEIRDWHDHTLETVDLYTTISIFFRWGRLVLMQHIHCFFRFSLLIRYVHGNWLLHHHTRFDVIFFFVSATAIKLIRFQLIFSLRYRKRALKEISTYCFNCHRKLPIKYLVRFFLPPPFQCASSLALLHYWPIVLGAFHAHNVSVDENRKC